MMINSNWNPCDTIIKQEPTISQFLSVKTASKVMQVILYISLTFENYSSIGTNQKNIGQNQNGKKFLSNN